MSVRSWLLASVTGGLCVWLAGCADGPPLTFEKNLVYEFVVEKTSGRSVASASDMVHRVLTETLGRPDALRVPDEFADVIDRDKLAAGQVVYDAQCANCHGESGNGRGPLAAMQTPYPRDFRMGVFKYKSSLPGERPLVDDFARLIVSGVPGTAMKPMSSLSGDDCENAAHYVVYLSCRGEVERGTWDQLAESGDGSLDVSYDDVAAAMQTVIDDVAKRWRSSRSFTAGLRVPDFIAERGAHADWEAAVRRGAEVFLTRPAACGSCHRVTDEGQALPPVDQPLHDMWTEEWTTRIGISPSDDDALVPLIARGALPPREVTPRRLGFEPLHGGDEAAGLFSRIKYGIDGTRMQRATISDDETWDLVAYVLSLSAGPDGRSDRKRPVEARSTSSDSSGFVVSPTRLFRPQPTTRTAGDGGSRALAHDFAMDFDLSVTDY